MYCRSRSTRDAQFIDHPLIITFGRRPLTVPTPPLRCRGTATFVTGLPLPIGRPSRRSQGPIHSQQKHSSLYMLPCLASSSLLTDLTHLCLNTSTYPTAGPQQGSSCYDIYCTTFLLGRRSIDSNLATPDDIANAQ